MSNCILTQALDTLCTCVVANTPKDQDLTIEVFPFQSAGFQILDGVLSAHARIEIFALCQAVEAATRAIPRSAQITPSYRLGAYDAGAFTEIGIMLTRDFLWDGPFSNTSELIRDLKARMSDIAKSHPAADLQTYALHGDGSGIFADGRIYDVRASSEAEAIALFNMMRSRVGHGTDIKDIKKIEIKRQPGL
jgi:hypothetical protein